MTTIENLQPGQRVSLPSGLSGRVEQVSTPLPGRTLRELVIVDETGALIATYLGRAGEDLPTS